MITSAIAAFPHTASRLKDHVRLDTPMEAFSGRGGEQPDGFVSVASEKRGGAWSADGHFLPRDPIGKGGGAIFGMRVIGLNAVQPNSPAKLVGISTDWKGKQIIGASISTLVPLLDKLAEPR